MKELTNEELEKLDKLINWQELSETLTNNRTQISRKRIGKKYQKPIDELRKLLHYWSDYIERNKLIRQIKKQ